MATMVSPGREFKGLGIKEDGPSRRLPQYFDDTLLKTIEIQALVIPLSTDNYDEASVYESIKEAGIDSCYALALQFSIVGIVGNNYGKCKINGMETDIGELARTCGLKLNNKTQARLSPGDLTFKRLARFFRLHIHRYIQETGNISFLQRKYGDPSDKDAIVFPGAEYYVYTDSMAALVLAYRKLDTVHGTNFAEKVERIIKVRTLMHQPSSD